MELGKASEDYLEAILILQKGGGMVRSVDLAHHMGYSKPSICHAVSVLKKGNYLTMDSEGYLHLTDSGKKIAEKVYEKHLFLTDMLVSAGVSKEVAERDACKMEHGISDESFGKLKKSFEQ